MADALTLERGRTAVLCMDYQTAIVTGYATNQEALLARAAAVLAAARQAGMLVMHIVVGFRAGYPEISPRNATFSGLKQSGRFTAGAPGTEIHPAVAPVGEDVVVTKHRVSAFAETDLATILRAQGIETLVLFGIATSGVVLSTVRHGADADYRLVVVEDCCADGDAEVHRVLTTKVFPRQASVVTAQAVLQAMSAPSGKG